MSKAEEEANKRYCITRGDDTEETSGIDMQRALDFIEGYHQAEKDIKEELSNLFQEFMLDCVKDDTETHILHFVDVFNNKIKTIGNE